MEETVSSLKGYTYKLNEKKKTFFLKKLLFIPLCNLRKQKKDTSLQWNSSLISLIM